MVSRRAADGSLGPHSGSPWPGAELKLSGRQKRRRRTPSLTRAQHQPIKTHTHTVTDHTNTHKYKQRHVPDRSSDLFLFWGSLGFFTGGLRFGGFSTLLGLSLSVPEHSEDKQVRYRRSLTWRHRRPRRGEPYLHRRTWPSCSSAASPAPEVWVLLPLNRAKMGKAHSEASSPESG